MNAEKNSGHGHGRIMNPYLSLVIPAYNEGKRLLKNLDTIRLFFSSQNYAYEVIVVNDGSQDDTESVVQRYQQGWSQLLFLSDSVNHGKGFSVRKGVLAASGDFVFFCDADLSTPLHECDSLLAGLLKGNDMVVGSRYLKRDKSASGQEKEVSQTVLRRMTGRTFSFIVRSIVSPGVHDTQCGFKGFTRKSANALFSHQKLNGFAFDVEILYLARKFGLKVSEIPVEWHEDPSSKVSLFRDSMRMFADVVKIRMLHAGGCCSEQTKR